MEVPTIYKALCKGIYPQNMALYGTVQYLHFRILKFPLNKYPIESDALQVFK